VINISTIIVLASIDGSVFEKSYIGSQLVSCTFHSVTCYFCSRRAIGRPSYDVCPKYFYSLSIAHGLKLV
jgi:hypothetical protein